MATKISQREAHRLRKQIAALEAEKSARKTIYSRDYPGGINIGSIKLSDVAWAKLETARRLDHYLVATLGIEQCILIYAVK